MEFILVGIAIFFIFAVLEAIFEFIGELLGGLVDSVSPAVVSAYVFTKDNIYAISGVLVLIFALCAWEYLREHPFEIIFKEYKAGIIKREVAVKRIVNSMYNYERDPIPSAFRSKLMERRLKAHGRRVRAETEFMNDVREYMKARARVE